MELVANFTLNNDSLDAEFDVSEVQNFDALFEIYASGTTWGSIDGDIANQTDLQNALDSKASNERVDGIVEAFDNDIESINDSITELSENLDDLESTVTDNYNELNSAIDSNHQAISNINNTIQSYGDIVSYDAADFATSAQGALADTALQPNDNISELTNDVGYITSASLPVVNNNRITIQKNGSPVGDFTLNQASDETININVPTTAADVGALPDTTTINDLTTTAQQEALNSGANTTNIGQISANTQAIQTETTSRENADNNLQSQIDALVVSSDVFDIVGTYAELQAYDISTVPVNDIIKVLVDSTHNNAATYYRCIENNGVKSWSYIGSEGAYYTKGEADSTFVPQTRTINNKALNQNINLTASDVGALPVGTQIGNGTILLTQGGVQKGTFTLNQTGNATIDFDAVSEDITVDSELSTTSTNPVQNKVITGALNDKQDVLTAGTDLEIVKVLPSDYTQLKSITATGSQYINTGILLTDNFKAEIVGRFTSTTGTQCLLGATVATTNATYRNEVLTKDSTKYYVNNGNPWLTRQTNSSAPLDTNTHTFVIEITSETTKISVDDVTNVGNYANINTDEDLYLFARNAVNATPAIADYAQFELESIKLYNSGELVFNGIPASNGSQAGLYDTVSETFMPSLGSSAFVAGDEVITQTIINFTNETGYITGIDSNDVTTALGYTPYNASNPNGYTSNVGTVTSVNGVQPINGNVTIETGGTVDQVFDGESANAQSGIAIQGALDEKQDKLVAGDNIEIIEPAIIRVPEGYTQLAYIYSSYEDCINTNLRGNIQWEIVAQCDVTTPTTRMLVSCTNSSNNSSWFGQNGYGWGTGGSTTGVSASEKAKIIVNFNTNDCTGTVNDVAFSYTAPASVNGNWFLLGSPNGSSSYFISAKLFSAIARQNGVIVFDGVPAKRDSDDFVGLYDLVSNKFFEPENGGEFEAGTVASTDTTIKALVGEGVLKIVQFGATKATFSANATNSTTCNLSPALAPKEINSSPLSNGSAQRASNSLLYCGNDDRIHSYTETNIPISLNYGMFTNTSIFSANSTATWYFKAEKCSWTVPTALRTFTSKQKVYAKCTYPDSSGNVYFIGTIGQSNTTNALEGGYTYYYLGIASSVSTVALNVSASHFMSIDTDGNLTHIDGVEIAQPEIKDLYDYYTLNVVTIGSPIITENVMSGFSTSNYARMGSIINSNNQPWEYFIKFTVNTIPSVSAYIIGGASGLTNGIYLYLTNNNKLGVCIGRYNTSFGTISANTTYKARIIVGADNNYNESLNVTNVYLYDENDILLSSKQISATWYNDIQSVFGVSNLTSPGNPFDGSIDFGETYINFLSNGTATRVWNGTEPTIDTKANTDLTNITDSAKVMMSGMGMPSDTYIDLTLGASNSTYTAPADGYFVILMNAVNNTNMTVGLTAGVGRVGFTTVIPANNNLQGGNFGGFIPVKKGDTASVFYNGTTSAFRFRFVYAVGSESEAS